MASPPMWVGSDPPPPPHGRWCGGGKRWCPPFLRPPSATLPRLLLLLLLLVILLCCALTLLPTWLLSTPSSVPMYPRFDAEVGPRAHSAFLRRIHEDISAMDAQLSSFAQSQSQSGSSSSSYSSDQTATPATPPDRKGGVVHYVHAASLSARATVADDRESNLVLGMAQDMDPKNLAVFCRSASRRLTSADVVIFVNHASLTPLNLQIVARAQAEAPAQVRFWLVVHDAPTEAQLLLHAPEEEGDENEVATLKYFSPKFEDMEGTCGRICDGANGISITLSYSRVYRVFCAARGILVDVAPPREGASLSATSAASIPPSASRSPAPPPPPPLAGSQMHPSTLRWRIVRRFLECRLFRESFGRILTIDARDSAFQVDVFTIQEYRSQAADSDTLARIHVFHGVEAHPIRDDGWNKGWIEDCFGSRVLNAVASNKILCSGVTLGDTRAMWSYVLQMHEVMFAPRSASSLAEDALLCRPYQYGEGARGEEKEITLAELSCRSRFPQCERNGVDQGAHNAIIHLGALKTLHTDHGDVRIETVVWSQSSSPIVNMQAGLYRVVASGSDSSPAPTKQVLNMNGNVVAIAHQYDRNAEYQSSLFKHYVYWTDTSNPSREIGETLACQKFKVWQDQDILKATCDLSSSGGATSPASCCSKCSEAPDNACGAFVFSGGTCFLKSRECIRGAAGSRGATDTSRPDNSLRPRSQAGVFSGVDLNL